MSYQGWANYETWNVALWFGNDYGLYQSVLGHHERFTAGNARAFVRGLLPSGTPDFRSRGGARAYAKVDWQEIAADFNEMRGEERSGNSVGEHRREELVYGVEYYDRSGARRIDGPFHSEAQNDRALHRATRIDPDAMAFQTTAARFEQLAGGGPMMREDRGGGPLAAARSELATHGMSIKKTDWGDYRVYRRGERDPDMGYFTPDLDDAVMTGIAISRGLSEGRMHEGRDRPITYTLHMESRGRAYTPSEWQVRARYGARGYGAPTDANLARHVRAFEASTRPGGPNAHLGPTTITRAWIVDQRTNQTVASYEAPMFQVIEGRGDAERAATFEAGDGDFEAWMSRVTHVMQTTSGRVRFEDVPVEFWRKAFSEGFTPEQAVYNAERAPFGEQLLPAPHKPTSTNGRGRLLNHEGQFEAMSRDQHLAKAAELRAAQAQCEREGDWRRASIYDSRAQDHEDAAAEMSGRSHRSREIGTVIPSYQPRPRPVVPPTAPAPPMLPPGPMGGERTRARRRPSR